MKRLRLWLIERLMPSSHYLAERKPPEHFATMVCRGDYIEGVREFMLKDGVITELTSAWCTHRPPHEPREFVEHLSQINEEHLTLTGFPPSP